MWALVWIKRRMAHWKKVYWTTADKVQYLEHCWRWCDMLVLISLTIPMISVYHTHHAHHWWASSCVLPLGVTMLTWRGWHPPVTLIFLASSSCLLITTLANSLESCRSWYWMFRIYVVLSIRYPVCDLCIFQMSISCAVHYIWQCPTHPLFPHIVNTVISILISRTGILAVLRSSWEEIIVKVTLNFKCPLWTH